MSGLYCKNGIWYISVTISGIRYRKSLRTKDKKIAKSLMKSAEREILRKALNPEEQFKTITFKELSKRYFAFNHNLKASTQLIYKQKVDHFLKHGVPENAGHQNMVARTVNLIINWGLKRNLKTKQKKLKAPAYEKSARTRIYSKEELELILNKVLDDEFQRWVRFVYYTGVRFSEALSYNPEDNSVIGKRGRRIIKISNQAKEVLDEQGELWDYTEWQARGKWRRNMKRLNIENARVHDLRRTFGYNLIKNGMSIYKVSKLLGQKSVITTERHYAPLLPADVDDFTL